MARGDEVLAESAAPGSDYLAEVCVAWEKEAQAAAGLGIRVVRLRIGIVLVRAGALQKMLPPREFLGKGSIRWVEDDGQRYCRLRARSAAEGRFCLCTICWADSRQMPLALEIWKSVRL